MTTPADIFDRIGQFLEDHRLSPDPAHYAFVHAILTNPEGSLARAVASLIDGGVRLHQDDIVRLGGPIDTAAPTADSSPAAEAVRDTPERIVLPEAEARSDALAQQTQNQVDSFMTVIRSVQADTSAFGANLARNVAEMKRDGGIGLAALASLTGEMLERINATERRLEQATAEADALREKLAEARATARRDPLTGLANRLAFTEALGQSFQARESCHLALCDVDRFKRINDELGHATGDRVLHSISKILAEEGQEHLVCRHGGEEFAILMTGLSSDQAAALVDRAREAVRSRRMRVRETGEPVGEVTFSAGVTALRPDDTQETLFARADSLLYRAKKEGRDRVCSDT
ncbi:GGDEF domain-containing protein [Sphingomonas fuzhouensis]|uniref:GGDEF domain-containing protein n=1 Tax=Sphingomonas fuzhouensis TaxID=3106033 RepID=UPI002AFE4101|nr:GGDEF domain-containing protein [Sphingomonas sp. SGZ-02]